MSWEVNLMTPSSNGPSKVSTDGYADIHGQALEWMVVFWSGEATNEDRREWQTWLDASPENLKAWEQVRAMEVRLKGMPAKVASLALREAPKSAKRRKLLQAMSGMIALGVTTQLARETSLWKSYSADFRTATGEQRHITLADGTHVNMNTGTSIDIRFSDVERRLIVRDGEILISTAKDTAPVHRPFIVETGHGTARALGTRFNVRQMEDLSRVAVYEGAIEIMPVKLGQPSRLNAGQQTMFTALHVNPATPARDDESAWVDGFIIAERMRLGDFLEELNRYRPGFIRCNEDIADLIVSGTYPLQDTDRVLHSLLHILPIKLHYVTRYWVRVAGSNI